MIEPAPLPATKKGTFGSPFFLPVAGPDENLGGLDYLFTPNAPGADANPLGRPIHEYPDGLKVGHPATLPPIIGVADMVASRRTLGANGADACHGDTSPLVVLVVDQAIKFKPENATAQGKLWRGH